MTTLQITITFLVVSVALNVVAFWFIRNILTKLFFVSSNLGEVNDVMMKFAEHLEQVHSMETFYGDQTLQALLAHSTLVVTMLQEFDEIYTMAEGYDNLGAAEQEEWEEEEDIDGEET